MKSGLFTALFISSALAFINAGAFETLYATDGDSLQGTDGEKARLLCIDAPELYQQGGEEAKQALQQLVGGNIGIETRGRDRHNRQLVLLTAAGGASINLQLIRTGQAWVARFHADTCGLPPQELFAAERQARKEKRGLWRQPNPKPPWQWRKENPRR